MENVRSEELRRIITESTKYEKSWRIIMEIIKYWELLEVLTEDIEIFQIFRSQFERLSELYPQMKKKREHIYDEMKWW